jgi:hypothetical protein
MIQSSSNIVASSMLVRYGTNYNGGSLCFVAVVAFVVNTKPDTRVQYPNILHPNCRISSWDCILSRPQQQVLIFACTCQS